MKKQKVFKNKLIKKTFKNRKKVADFEAERRNACHWKCLSRYIFFWPKKLPLYRLGLSLTLLIFHYCHHFVLLRLCFDNKIISKFVFRLLFYIMYYWVKVTSYSLKINIFYKNQCKYSVLLIGLTKKLYIKKFIFKILLF